MNQLNLVSPAVGATAQLRDTSGRAAQAGGVSPRTLLHLNINVFLQLRKLGTSRQRICSVLNLSLDEFDYICTLT